MKTWTSLLSEKPELPIGILHWWLSDYLNRSLTNLPLQETVSETDQGAFEEAVERLAKGEPVQYVCGKTPFRDLELKVDKRVLIPRPETEQLVQIVLDRFTNSHYRILDVGTGSGCIALSIKKARPGWEITGLDISQDAIDLARENAETLQLDVAFKQVDLLTDMPFRSSELIIANLPYIGTEEWDNLPVTVREYEPALALFSGPKGTDLILRLLEQAKDVLVPGGHLLLETGENQGDVWRKAAEDGKWEVEGIKDLAERKRFWIFSLPQS